MNILLKTLILCHLNRRVQNVTGNTGTIKILIPAQRVVNARCLIPLQRRKYRNILAVKGVSIAMNSVVMCRNIMETDR